MRNIYIIIMLLAMSGCSDRDSKIEALKSVINNCAPGGTVSLSVYVSFWDSVEATCTYTKE